MEGEKIGTRISGATAGRSFFPIQIFFQLDFSQNFSTEVEKSKNLNPCNFLRAFQRAIERPNRPSQSFWNLASESSVTDATLQCTQSWPFILLER